MVLQKVPGSSPHKAAWDARIERYARLFPASYVVDLPSAVRQISNRDTMLDAVRAVASSLPGVRAPRQIVLSAGSESHASAQVDAAGLQLPLLAKSLRADGTSHAHKVAIVHDQDGLACVSRGGVAGLAPPCVVQEYVNHGGWLFKVYVVGDAVTATRRKSLPDLRGARRSNRRRAKAAKEARQRTSDEAVASPNDEEVASDQRFPPTQSHPAREKKTEAPEKTAAKSRFGVGGREEWKKGESPPKKNSENTADVDGDVDDSGGSGSDASGDESESADDESGLQSVPRVSCFKGGARAGETSWRDRVDASPSGESPPGESPPSPEREPHSPIVSSAHYLTTTRSLDKRLAKTLTVGRVGSEDSVDEIALSGSDFDFGSARDLSGMDAATSPEGGSGGNESEGAASTKGQTRSSKGQPKAKPPLGPHGPRRHGGSSADHLGSAGFRRLRRTVSGSDLGAASDLTFTTSDGGTESDLGGGGESDLGAYESDRGALLSHARAMEVGGPGVAVRNQTHPDYRPDSAAGSDERRASDPEFPAAPTRASDPEVAERSRDPSKAAKGAHHEGCANGGDRTEGAVGPARVAMPEEGFLRELALGLRDRLGLRLFNFDLIRVGGDSDEFLVVDINYFPGIAKMPGYSDTFCEFLKSAKRGARARIAKAEGGEK